MDIIKSKNCFVYYICINKKNVYDVTIYNIWMTKWETLPPPKKKKQNKQKSTHKVLMDIKKKTLEMSLHTIKPTHQQFLNGKRSPNS